MIRSCFWALSFAVAVMVAPAARSAGEPPFGNPFGMQWRRPPSAATAVWAPVIVHPSPNNESCTVSRRDGSLEIYSIARPEGTAATVIRSLDGGITWTEPEIAFPLPGRAYYAIRVLEAADGSLQAVFHLQGTGDGGYRGRLYQVYHVRKPAGANAWSAPQLVVPGYVGSIRGFTELRPRGRLLLAVGRAVPERSTAPKSGPDFGWNDTVVYFSDDRGVTWRQSPDRLSLELASPNVTRYGAIEPVVLGRPDGGAWMLVRDRGGRLWQSFSADGARWAPLERSPFISSDSPAELLRLRNGAIVLFLNACQFWSDPRSYAMGGREVLQAAISSDEGKTWRGFREVLHETKVASKGDRGSAYPSAAETRDGKVVFASGQGEGKRAIVMFDPRWLEESQQRDELDSGPVWWTQYGDTGLAVVTHGEKRAVALPLKSGGLGGATWNFPSADSGELNLRIQIPAAVSTLRLCLTDHYNRVDDARAADHAVFAIPIETSAKDGPAEHSVRLRWSDSSRDGELAFAIDGKPHARIRAQRPAQFGINYLRIEYRAAADNDAVTVSDLAAMR